MEDRAPGVIDLDGELAKLTMCRRTPQTTMAERKGSVARLAAYRDGLLLALKFSGKDHWESHLTGDELIHILDGSATLEIVGEDGPRSFALGAGTIAVIPQGAWHRFVSAEGVALMAVTPFPGEHIELDVDDPRTVEGRQRDMKGGAPSIVDLNAEAARLTMFRGRTPQTTFAERRGSAAQLAPYRDGALLLGKSAGKGHWEAHPADELVYALDGTASLEVIDADGARSLPLSAGTITVVPEGAWHRALSTDGATVMTVTPFPGRHIDLDVDDPRTVEQQPA